MGFCWIFSISCCLLVYLLQLQRAAAWGQQRKHLCPHHHNIPRTYYGFKFSPQSSHRFILNSVFEEKEDDYIEAEASQKKNTASRRLNKDDLIRYRGRVAYDGSSFHGFQLQSGAVNKRTVQEALEEVLHRRFVRDTIRVVGAGRTDAGVHARGQAFHFDLTKTEHAQLENLKNGKPLPPLSYVMNKMLASDEISVWNVGPAPPARTKVVDNEARTFSWNAIYDTTHKQYSYRLCVGPIMDPIVRYNRWQVPGDGRPVNVTLLETALSQFEGTHDFRPFAGGMEQLEKRVGRQINTTRTIYSCQLVDESHDYMGRPGYYRIDVVLSGALYKMVRNLVGTAVEVSRGRMSLEHLQQLLQLQQHQQTKPPNIDSLPQKQLDRKNNPARPAPPEGLTMERVFYDDDADF